MKTKIAFLTKVSSLHSSIEAQLNNPTGTVDCHLVYGFMTMVLFTLSLLSLLWAEEAHRNHPEKTITAIRVNPKPPKIDGILDDEVWKHAPIATGLTQRDPNDGELATEETAFQVAYDDEALYVGVVCYDREPDKIVSLLARRDEFHDRDVDRISVSLDPHHDHQTGYYFIVYPSETLTFALQNH